MPAQDVRGRARPPVAASLLATLALCVAAIYGLITSSYPISLIQQKIPLSTQWLMQAVSSDFVNSSASVLRQITLNYTRGFAGIGLHTLFGGMALSLCTLQFIPALRRSSPKLHRVLGWAAAASTLVAMVGAMAYLAVTPAKDSVSGESFAAALWVQAVTTIMALGLAIRSARQREFRVHMGWMSLLMASLLNAPMLRLESVVVGHALPINVFQANAGLAVILMPQAVWLMSWWMRRIGRLDLPLPPPSPTLPASTIQVLSGLGVLTVIHEGLLAPFGWDALSHWRSAATLLPGMAAPWALSTAALLLHVPREMQYVQSGQAIRPLTLSWLAASAVSALLVLTRLQLPSDGDVHLIGRLFFWAAWGVSGLLICLGNLLWRQTSPALAPWRILTVLNALLPGLWLPFAGVLALTGWSFSAIQTAAITLSWGFVAWHGFACAYGLPLPGPQAKNRHTDESCPQV